MTNLTTYYQPLNKLAFHYNKIDKKLYVKSAFIINLKQGEALVKLNQPTLGSAALIQYEVDTVATTDDVYVERILLMENINASEESLEADLRELIEADMLLKKISMYVVTVVIDKPDASVVGHATSTISSDDTIDIE